jgi:addiction module HigA family antidote
MKLSFQYFSLNQAGLAWEAIGRARNLAAYIPDHRQNVPVNEKRGISPEMAVRLSKVFGGSAESWLVQQAQYDLAHVRAGRMKLKRLELA